MPETQATPGLPGILRRIVASKRDELARLESRRDALAEAAAAVPPARDFHAALVRPGAVALIAECKRRSPGAGEIRPGLDPGDLARAYADHGASALSVLTDAEFFGGTLDDLAAARSAAPLPALRKDFTLDSLHLLEARAGGADAVLLIVRILDDATLARLHAEAEDLGMAVLVEAHDAEEVRRGLDAGARILGINNRDLATFTTDLDTTLRLLEHVPDEVVVVSESGIRTPDDVRRIGAAGVDAILVGETLLRADDPGLAAASLAGLPRTERVR